jgi:glycosyltransferase involved in cell wall biosynthesis
MLIGLARALAKIGHRVTIFTKFANLDDEGEYEGVTFRSHETFNDMMQPVEWDVFISCRTPSIMAAPVKAKARFLWLQDELILPKVLMGHLWQTDRLIFVSEWHKQHYCERLPELEKLSWVTRNGVDLKLIQESIQGVERDRNSLIYISRPERGLDPLLQIFPKILERAPDTRLKICRYNSMYDPLPNVAAVCARADRMVAQTEGAQYLGHLGKAELYREIASSRLMVYPGVPNFNETSCIAAIEAQACGTPLICSNKGGLRETLDDEAGVKIDGDAFSCVYQERFADEVISLLTDDARVGGMQIAGSGHVQRYDYDLIAVEWDAMFDKFFESRFEARSEGVYLQLLRHDDIVGALACAELADQDHAASICARLIAESVDERDLHKSDYAKHALEPAFETSQRSPRFEAVLQVTSQEVDTDLPFRVLDFHACKSFPECDCHGCGFFACAD